MFYRYLKHSHRHDLFEKKTVCLIKEGNRLCSRPFSLLFRGNKPKYFSVLAYSEQNELL